MEVSQVSVAVSVVKAARAGQDSIRFAVPFHRQRKSHSLSLYGQLPCHSRPWEFLGIPAGQPGAKLRIQFQVRLDSFRQRPPTVAVAGSAQFSDIFDPRSARAECSQREHCHHAGGTPRAARSSAAFSGAEKEQWSHPLLPARRRGLNRVAGPGVGLSGERRSAPRLLWSQLLFQLQKLSVHRFGRGVAVAQIARARLAHNSVKLRHRIGWGATRPYRRPGPDTRLGIEEATQEAAGKNPNYCHAGTFGL